MFSGYSSSFLGHGTLTGTTVSISNVPSGSPLHFRAPCTLCCIVPPGPTLKSIDNITFSVIFVTAFQEYAIQAIKFSALDYLLKPIDSEELKQAIDNALNTITRKTDESQISVLQHNMQINVKRKLVLKTQESVHVVEIDNIVRCESDKNYTLFYFMNAKKILVSKTLKDFDILLAGLTFFRAQQSHLINLNYVERYNRHEGTIIMKDGSAIPLALARKEQFFEILDAL
jgi:two-component system LytT family response regulator